MYFDSKINIKNKEIGGSQTFIIAELGSNHNQDMSLAYESIDAILDTGADAIKFQSIKANELYLLDTLSNSDRELLKQIELKEEWYSKIFDYCKKRNILFFSTPTYLDAVDILIEKDVQLMKIASPQTYGFPKLIEKIGKSNIATIMSTGYCNYGEIERAVNIFKKTGNKKLVLLHCIANYPTSPHDANLNFIETLGNMFGVIPGYSDHTLGYHVAIGAVAKGAKVIEKHFTLSRDMDGPDHFFALEPDEFKEMVEAIRDVEKSIVGNYKNNLTAFESNFRNEIEMKICASKDITEGETITLDNIRYLRNKNKKGISAWEEDKVIGKKANRKIEKNEFFELNDIIE